MVKPVPLDAIPDETKALIGMNAARVYCSILGVLADRNTRSTIMTIDRLAKTARCGVPPIESAHSVLHRHGLVDIQLEHWDLTDPMRSKFSYTLPESSTNNN
jgi:hypothetical protein